MWSGRAILWMIVGMAAMVLILFSTTGLPAQPRIDGSTEFARDVFFVKFTEAARSQVAFSKTAHVGRTGIASIDVLNDAARVERIVPVFRHGGRFEARHHRYGLDRWYRFFTDGATDVADLLDQYRSDPHIVSAALQPLPTLEPQPTAAATAMAVTESTTTTAPDDTLFSQQWSFNNTGQTDGKNDADIDLPEAWTIETGDPSVVVAVLDTGVDPNHPDLAPNIWRNAGEIEDNGLDDDDNGYIDDTWGWDFFNDDNDPTYGEAHGAHTSGTVVALTNNETGVAGIAGGWGPDKPGSRVMVIAGHWGYPEAIVYAADNGATIASYSWSGTTFTFEIVEEVFRYFVETAQGPDETMPGGMIIFSAGNEGTSQWQYPKAYSDVMAVAATDHNDELPDWSNHGEWVDIAAPGVSVLSTFVHSAYKVYSGTSMAAPHVAGVAALVRSARPDLPAAAVRYILEESANPITQHDLRTGRLNAHEALELATGPLPDLFSEPPDLNFRTVTLGLERTMTVTLWNIASVPHTVFISTDNPRFHVGTTQVTVPAHAAAKVEVAFQPSQKELERGTLTFSHGGMALDLALRGDAHEFMDHFVGLQAVAFPSLDWADYDADGDLDLLLTGESGSPAFKERHAIIYRNNGDQTFTDAEVDLNGVTNGRGTWVDYDNDEDFDVLLTGESNGLFDTRLFRNDGDGAFTLIDSGFPALIESRAAWADFDNDGFKDLALIGSDPPYAGQPSHYLLLYKNLAGQSFEQAASLPGVSSGDLAWNDYDKDGDVDLAVCGWDRINRSTVLYRNDDGVLSATDESLIPIKDCSVTWGDLDSDGDADLLITGESASGPTTAIYRNDGNGTLSVLGQTPETAGGGLSPTRVGSGSLGDYDNDGDLDVVLTGYTGSVRSCRLFQNRGGLQFIAIEDFVGLANSIGAWADFDTDDDLDVVVAGQDPNAKYTRLYRNEGARQPNERPTPPDGLNASVDGGDVTLQWTSGSDGETPAASLTYEVRIGSIPGATDVVAAPAATDGRRMIVKLGNAGHRTAWTFRNLENGTYYWSAQSVDSGFRGSPFAPEASFTITDSPIGSPNVEQAALRFPADSAIGEPTSLTLSWEPLANAKFYQTQVSATPDFGALVLDETTIGVSMDFTATVAEHHYYWRVRGLRGDVVGAWSEPWTFLVGEAGKYAPQLTFPTHGSTHVAQPVTLVWTVAPEAVSYELQVSSSPSFQSSELIIPGLTRTQQTVSGLSAGTLFYWRVRGSDVDDKGTWSTSRTFETLSAPSVVALIAPVDGVIDQDPEPTLEWSVVDLANSYQIQIDSISSFVQPVVDTVGVTGVELALNASLSGGVTYWWRVRAINEAGLGPWSDHWRFTVARGTGTEDDFLIPDVFRLYPVYPNPPTRHITLSFDLPQPSPATISLFDVTGRRLIDLLRADLPAGRHRSELQLPLVASGVYLIRIEAGDFIDSEPLIIVGQ